MKCSLKKISNPATHPGDCLILVLPGSAVKLPEGARMVDEATGGLLGDLIKTGDFKGNRNETLLLSRAPSGLTAKRLLLLGGATKTCSESEFIRIFEGGLQKLMQTPAKKAFLWLEALSVEGRDQNWQIQQIARLVLQNSYRYNKTLGKPRPEPQLKELIIATATTPQNAQKKALQRGLAIAEGVNLARELGNLPANICTPGYLAKQAQSLAKKYPALKTKVLAQAELRKLKMGCLLAVSQGSREPPCVIVMEYKNAAARNAPIAVVGKGVTFDTGGISIKPSGQMDEMKFDMCGAASVFGVMKTVAELQLPINLVGLVGAVENMPDGKAIKPGDVVTSMAGHTVEILNTDAEGRLVLCDVLHYAQQKYKPKSMIDIATLTGACVVALGSAASGLYSNRDPLAAQLQAAGDTAGDRAWHMPLWPEYHQLLKSNFADIPNIGGGRKAGSITAACFLERFIDKNCPWAHLDIAGSAWLEGGQKGATGRPVPLLSQYLIECAESKN